MTGLVGLLLVVGIAAPGEVVLSVVGTNDLHGHVESLPLLGGFVKNLRARRAADGGAVLLVDAGDMFQGTLESNLGEGAAVVDGYRALGYAAVAIGNHEFDFGPVGPHPVPREPGDDPQGALKARAAAAPFPFLCANMREPATARLFTAPNVRASAIVKAAGVSIGLVGVTTLRTTTSTLAANVAGLTVEPLATAIEREARQLRARGATVIVALAHAGASCRRFQPPDDTSSCDKDAEIFDVARALPGGLVDAIVAGHTHARVAHVVAGIPIIESEEYGQAFGRIDLVVDRKTGKVRAHRLLPTQFLCPKGQRPPDCAAPPYEGAEVVSDAEVRRVLEPAFAAAAGRRAEPLGVEVTSTIKRAHKEESALGNLFADLMRAARPKADVTITNGGGLRRDLPVGPLLYGTLFEATPFDNTFATTTLTADELARVLARNLTGPGGIVSVSGIRAEARCADGQLDVTVFDEDGRPLPGDERLTLVTSDFLATGGDRLFPKKQVFTIEDHPPIRDAMADVLRRRGGRLDGGDGSLVDRARPRLAFPGRKPVRCPPGVRP